MTGSNADSDMAEAGNGVADNTAGTDGQAGRQPPPPQQNQPAAVPTVVTLTTDQFQELIAKVSRPVAAAEIRAEPDMSNPEAPHTSNPLTSNFHSQSNKPIVPINEFKEGADASAWADEFKLYNQLHKNYSLLPGALMLSAFRNNEEAMRWLRQVTNLDQLTADELITGFEERFAQKVRDDAEEAMEKLVSGNLSMDPKKGVADYASRFRFELRKAGVPAETPVKALQNAAKFMFRRGLTADLRAECRVDYQGNEFADFEQLIAHAIGAEKRLKEMRKTTKMSFAFASTKRQNTFQQSGGKRPRHDPAPRAQPRGQGHVSQHRGHGHATQPARQMGQPQARKPNPLTKGLRLPTDKTTHLGPNGQLLSFAELKYFRANGLCHNCGQQGHLREHCPKPTVEAAE